MNSGSTIPSLPSSPLTHWPPSKHAIIITIIAAVAALAALLAGYYYFVPTTSQVPGINSLLRARSSKVELKTEYKNPFDRNNQYVNPFSEFKSPFTSLQ